MRYRHPESREAGRMMGFGLIVLNPEVYIWSGSRVSKMWIPNIMCYRYAWNWILTQRE